MMINPYSKKRRREESGTTDASGISSSRPAGSNQVGGRNTGSRPAPLPPTGNMDLATIQSATRANQEISIIPSFDESFRSKMQLVVKAGAKVPPSSNAGISQPIVPASASPQRQQRDHQRKSPVQAGLINAAMGPTTSSATAAAAPTNNLDGSRRSITSTASALVIAAAPKAGMDNVDRARIDEIILRHSGNSLFMQQQRKRDEKVNVRLTALQQTLQEHNCNQPNWRETMQAQVDAELAVTIVQRPQRCTHVVVDMDMFYMACELLSRPDLVHVPACVGHSMITTSNYVARQYGVRAAMAGWIGDALVHELSQGQQRLHHVRSNFDLYRAKAALVQEVLREYDPHLRAYSLDEAYLDLGPYLVRRLLRGMAHDDIVREFQQQQQAVESANVDDKEDGDCQTDGGIDDRAQRHTKAALLDGDNLAVDDIDNNNDNHRHAAANDDAQQALAAVPEQVCLDAAAETLLEMRAAVQARTGGLTCSAGLAPNFMLAKIASDRHKPNGQCIVGSHHVDVTRFLYPLSIRKVGGIGRVTEKILQAFGIHTVQDLYNERALVKLLFQPATAAFLLRASVGCCSSSSSSSSDQVDNDDVGADAKNSSGGGQQKGISRERTFRAGQSWTEINSKLEDIGRLLSSDMQRKHLHAHTVTVKVKLHTFDVLSKARTLDQGVYVQATEPLVAMAHALLREIRQAYEGKSFSVRLLGIRCSNFGDPSSTSQQSIDESFARACAVLPKQEKSSVSDRMGGPMDRFLLRAKPARVSIESANERAIVHDRSLVDSADTLSGEEFHQQANNVLNSVDDKPRSSTNDTFTTKQIDAAAAAADGEITNIVANVSEATAENGANVSQPLAPPQDVVAAAAAEVVADCPICRHKLVGLDNASLNCHIDACLNGPVVRQVIRATAAAPTNIQNDADDASPPPRRKQRLTDFWAK